MELFKVITVEEAVKIVEDKFNYKLKSEKISILNALGRISYEDIKSRYNIPNFKRSTVDGFAINSRDVLGASESIPSIMDLKGEILMGMSSKESIDFPGECFYVPTGGMVPVGADSVVMIEYSDKLSENTILINSTVAKGENVIQIGEDIKEGEVIIKGGQKLRPYEIGVLASLGISEIEVYKKAKVGIISTGDEVVPCENQPKIGEVRDINTYLLWSELLQDNAEPISYGIIKDDYEALKAAVDRAINECDIVLISGGSSVGKKDQSLKVIDSYKDGGVIVHGIAVKPGKPTLIGKANEKVIFGLPGHPLACSVIYKILVKKYLDKLNNHKDLSYGISASMSINYHKAKGREEYLPVALENVNGKIVAKPVFGKSGLISVFSMAYGYVKIDKNVEGLREGEEVLVYRF